MMNDLLYLEYFNNTVLDYLISLLIIVVGISLVRLFKKTILQRLKKFSDRTSNAADNFVLDSIERFGLPALHYFIVYSGLTYLDLSVKVERVLQVATSVVITFFILRLLSSTILLLLKSHLRKQERGDEKVRQLGGLMLIINMVIWMLGIVFLIDNLGYDVTTIIAGLGIGGIAVALAAQNILGDLFNYFVIFFDRPFEVGDFIIVDDKLGTVEYIGLKTTRIRSLSGEQLVIGNSNLTSSRIHNYKRMNTRRIVFTIDVDYSTPLEKLELIPGLLKSAILEQKDVVFDRAHFAAYKDWSLGFEVVYIVQTDNYNKYMDIHQAINFAIFRMFEEYKIEFAFPTQKMFLANKITLQEPSHTDGQ